MTLPSIELMLSDYDRQKFAEILERNMDRLRALRDLRHTTEAERQVFIYEMALCQTVLLQITGTTWQPANGAPDWSAAEASGKLPSEALAEAGIIDDGAAHEAACQGLA